MQDFTQLFPVTLTANWQHLAASEFSQQLGSWLFNPDSLTGRLKSHCRDFRVELLGQEQMPCPENEACEHIRAGELVIVREVLLYCDNVPHVFARSLMPLATLTGDEAFLSELGNQSLGQAIFNSPYLTRGDFSVAAFDASSSVAQLSEQLSLSMQGKLWGRRSIFFLHDKPLAVAEVFLPNAIAYQTSEEVA